jgi:hypothetical protein
MVEIEHDALVFSFPEVHPSARLRITFKRTLRIPDDDRAYPLPPGLGAFPLRHVDDHAENVPESWLRRGGITLPMHQAEAMWLSFDAQTDPERAVAYPFAVKVAAGKIDAVTGAPWSEGLSADAQDYMVVPTQPWLDGFAVERGVIRQFVAMPLGRGYSAEEQLTGAAEFGGLQILAYPMRRKAFERRFPKMVARMRGAVQYDMSDLACASMPAPACADMGLAPGGRMRQEIYEDPYDARDWERTAHSRCFVHLCNAERWQAVTGQAPPPTPADAAAYARAGLPWFDWYAGGARALDGSERLAHLKSVEQLAAQKGDLDVPVVASFTAEHVRTLRAALKPGQVREGTGW